MSIALYRRYRPDSFQEVIGQEHVTKPLMNALNAGRINHAYLFSGPRGCGKTTSARIMARCLNCAQGPTATPCGQCESCRELATGGSGSLDVVEIDAASHNGVDDARDLRERALFSPVRDRYKIFILDEAHMVTPQGFNALLKVVEEPPEHIKFIFATTEPDKVLTTIRSRTHHYPFRLVPPAIIEQYLQEICNREGVEPAEGVLSLVMRAGGGSVRDTLSVLDQLMAGATAGKLEYGVAQALLGYTDTAILEHSVDALIAADGAQLFQIIDQMIKVGHDPRRYLEDLLLNLRDLLMLSLAPTQEASETLVGVSPDRIEVLIRQAEAWGPQAISRAADITSQALSEFSGATAPRLQVELLAARLLLAAGASGGEGVGAVPVREVRGGRNSGPAVRPDDFRSGPEHRSGIKSGKSRTGGPGSPGVAVSSGAGETAHVGIGESAGARGSAKVGGFAGVGGSGAISDLADSPSSQRYSGVGASAEAAGLNRGSQADGLQGLRAPRSAPGGSVNRLGSGDPGLAALKAPRLDQRSPGTNFGDGTRVGLASQRAADSVSANTGVPGSSDLVSDAGSADRQHLVKSAESSPKKIADSALSAFPASGESADPAEAAGVGPANQLSDFGAEQAETGAGPANHLRDTPEAILFSYWVQYAQKVSQQAAPVWPILNQKVQPLIDAPGTLILLAFDQQTASLLQDSLPVLEGCWQELFSSASKVQIKVGYRPAGAISLSQRQRFQTQIVRRGKADSVAGLGEQELVDESEPQAAEVSDSQVDQAVDLNPKPRNQDVEHREVKEDKAQPDADELPSGQGTTKPDVEGVEPGKDAVALGEGAVKPDQRVAEPDKSTADSQAGAAPVTWADEEAVEPDSRAADSQAGALTSDSTRSEAASGSEPVSEQDDELGKQTGQDEAPSPELSAEAGSNPLPNRDSEKQSSVPTGEGETETNGYKDELLDHNAANSSALDRETETWIVQAEQIDPHFGGRTENSDPDAKLPPALSNSTAAQPGSLRSGQAESADTSLPDLPAASSYPQLTTAAVLGGSQSAGGPESLPRPQDDKPKEPEAAPRPRKAQNSQPEWKLPETDPPSKEEPKQKRKVSGVTLVQQMLGAKIVDQVALDQHGNPVSPLS